ncbi:MAG: YggT family protein [Ornithinimicrobium sp.]|uniref:YggT family protein n=1 Tax=Ornithinimicrobium sp. TaxID=1977084 RepID=UPI0026E0ECD0|nr:YggT family protein [Ornithinimicrobium sp.]MDO5741254.1 YggT family protein [Ornithinimicrobium sp.]
MVGEIIYLVLTLYLFVLIGRLIFDWVQVFSRDWRPQGPVLVLANGIYQLTDPPLNALRKVVPPVRLGGIALDLGFLILIIGVSMASSFARALPF